MSWWHSSLTLYGRRDVHFETTAAGPKVWSSFGGDSWEGGGPVVIQCHPGHLYCGLVTGAAHQVHHCRGDLPLPRDYFFAPEGCDAELGQKPLSVTIQMRTATFSKGFRAPNRKRNAVPTDPFKVVADAVRRVVVEKGLLMPTLASCQDHCPGKDKGGRFQSQVLGRMDPCGDPALAPRTIRAGPPAAEEQDSPVARPPAAPRAGPAAAPRAGKARGKRGRWPAAGGKARGKRDPHPAAQGKARGKGSRRHGGRGARMRHMEKKKWEAAEARAAKASAGSANPPPKRRRRQWKS